METTTDIEDNCDVKLNRGDDLNDILAPSHGDIENKFVLQGIPELNTSANLSAINDSEDIVDSSIINLNDKQNLITSLVGSETYKFLKSNDKVNSGSNNVHGTLSSDSNKQEYEAPTGASSDKVNTVIKDTPDNLTYNTTSQESEATKTVLSNKVDNVEKDTLQESEASNTFSSDKVDDVEKDTLPESNTSDTVSSAKVDAIEKGTQESEASNTFSSDKVDDVEKDTLPESNTSDTVSSTKVDAIEKETQESEASNTVLFDKGDDVPKYTLLESHTVSSAEVDIEIETADNFGDDNIDKMEIVKSENIDPLIKEEQEEVIQLHKKFAYKGARKRKQTQLYVATEKLKQRNRPPQITEEEPNFPEEDENECGICKRVFDNKKARFNHERVDHRKDSPTVYKCMQCNTYCDTNQQLRDHKECHSEDTFVCQKCKLAYDNHLNYLTHSIRHYPTQKCYSCEECQMKLFDKSALKTHMHTHYNVLVQCNICKIKVARQQISQHKAEHNKLKCVECGKICKGQSHYTQHMNTHIGYKPYQCLYCGKGYHTSCAKRIHMDMHLGIKKFKCNQCDRQFRQVIDLTRHKETHAGKQFECSFCQKKFLHKQSLQQHMRAHTGDHLLKCPECSQGFTTKTVLRSHIIHKHTRAFNYKCEVCDLPFLTKRHLGRHYESIRHQQKEYAFNNKDK